jgi:type IV pilus assembly protein PilA
MIRGARQRRHEDDEGFTLIELLVVMIIIGILATIAIPVFLNQRKGGYNAAVKTDLANVANAFESAVVEKGGDYTLLFAAGKGKAGDSLASSGSLTVANLAAATVMEFSGTQNVNLTLGADITPLSFCVYGENALNTGTFWVTSRLKGGVLPGSYPTAALAKAAC